MRLGYAVMAFFGVSFTTVEWFYLQVMPATHWFEYESVEPEQPSYGAGPINFVSFSQIHRLVDMRWNDVLFCDTDDGMGFRSYSSFDTSRRASPPVPMQPKAWTYHGEVPEQGECYLVSTIEAPLKYGIVKRQVLTGPRYRLVQRSG